MTSVEKWLSAYRRSEGGGDICDISDKSTNPGLLGGDKLVTSWRHFGSQVEHTPTTQPSAPFFATLSPPGGDKRRQQYQGVAANVANVINWEAGKAARDLCRVLGTDRLDELRDQLANGHSTRMIACGLAGFPIDAVVDG